MERRDTRVSMRGAQFVDPSALARIRNLELLARTVVDGFINGLHRAPHLGFSLDFAEHRGYVPGDDIRRMDWRLWARTDRYYIKEYEADTNAGVLFALAGLAVLAQSGHGINVEEPALFNRVVEDFFHRAEAGTWGERDPGSAPASIWGPGGKP